MGGETAMQHSFDNGLCTYSSSDPGTLSQSWVFGITGFQNRDPGTNPKIGIYSKVDGQIINNIKLQLVCLCWSFENICNYSRDT